MRYVLFPKKDLQSPSGQRADFVELFFDLVFVYAITRITAETAHHPDFKHIVQSVLTFWLIWWGWTQYTWALNAANTRLHGIRLIMLAATGVAFVMASSADEAFGEAVLWFAVPYIIIRAIGLLLYTRVTSNLKDHQAAVLSFALPSILGLATVLAGALADPETRIWWWLGTIVLDMVAGYIGGKREGWNLHAAHFAERHGLIVIIALGESLIVSASAVSSLNMSADLMVAGGLAVAVTCLLWWSYFGWVMEHLEEHLAEKTGSAQATNARDAYSFVHFLLICGIIGLSAGFEIILQHPGNLLTLPVMAALCGGYLLFNGFTVVAVWRTSKTVLVPRLVLVALTVLALVFMTGRSPSWALGIIAVSLLVQALVEKGKLMEVQMNT